MTAVELTRVYQIDLNNEYTFSDSLNGIILDSLSLQYPNEDIQTACPHQYTSNVVPLDSFMSFDPANLQINYLVDSNASSPRPSAGVTSYTLDISLVDN